jgi:hypothetical protein
MYKGPSSESTAFYDHISIKSLTMLLEKAHIDRTKARVSWFISGWASQLEFPGFDTLGFYFTKLKRRH